MADAFTSTQSWNHGRDLAPPPAPQTTSAGGVLRCPGDGTEGQLRPEGFWQCPTCGIRLDPTPQAANEQPAIPALVPQPNKAQDLQLIPAAQQPHAHVIASMIPTVDLTAESLAPTPEFKPADTAETNHLTIGPASSGDGFTEPLATDAPAGGRADDPTLGAAAAPYVAPEPPAPVVSYPPLEPEPLEAPGRIDPVPFTEPEGVVQ